MPASPPTPEPPLKNPFIGWVKWHFFVTSQRTLTMWNRDPAKPPSTLPVLKKEELYP